MTTLSKTICVAAGVSMAALVATGAASSAQAGEQAVHIRVGDLNLNTPQGHATFESRVNTAARRLCEDRRDLGANIACQRDVRAEAEDGLNELASRGNVHLAWARR